MLKKEHLEILLRPYGIDAFRLEFIQCSQNYVYKVCDDDGCRIVRICKGRYRNETEVAAELEWIKYLADHDIKACQPTLSNEGKLYHSFEIDGEVSIVTVFEHAPGVAMHRKLADEKTSEKLGRLTGRMHAIASKASQFEKDDGSLSRPLWYQSRLLNEDFDTCRAVLSKEFLAGVKTLIHDLTAIPKNTDSFGLLHGDIHFDNLFEDKGELWIYDFDNCEYGYFVQDLATILWDSIYCKELNKFADDGLNDRIRPLWKALLKGYAETSPMKELHLEHLEKFFLLREAIIYVHFHMTLNLSEAPESVLQGLEVMRRNVETQSHQVDFSLISKHQKHIKIVITPPCVTSRSIDNKQ